MVFLKENLIEVPNPLYKQDAENTIKTCRLFASMIGLWPSYKEDTITRRLVKFFFIFLYYFTTLFTHLSSVLNGIFTSTGLQERLIIVGPVAFWTLVLTKYSVFWYHSEDILECIKFIEEDWKIVDKQEHRQAMLKTEKFGRYMTILFAIFMYSGGISYHLVVPLTAEPITTVKNITVQPLPTPAFGTFFTDGRSPVYELVFTVQVTAGIINDALNVMTFSIAAVFILHACGQFDVTIMHLNQLVSEATEKHDVIHDRLVIIVRRHLQVLRFVSLLEKLLTGVCLIEVIGSTLVICFLGYYIIMAFGDMDISIMCADSFLIVSFILNVFVYCYIGELLTSQATKVGECVYMIQWYKLPNEIILELIFLIRVSQFPAKITAGKFLDLSLMSFSAIMRTSAAYFNFVWRMSQ